MQGRLHIPQGNTMIKSTLYSLILGLAVFSPAIDDLNQP
jgi:hypothetical protein